MKWTESFLKDRNQKVRIGSVTSLCTNVISGIPQGSVLGPILFLLFINDLPEVVQSSVKLFADDIKLHSAIDRNENCVRQQSDIDNLAAWSDKWLIKFNTGKCQSSHIGRKNG